MCFNKNLLLVLFLIFAIGSVGCGMTPYSKGFLEYSRGNFQEATKQFEMYKDKTDDISYPMLLMELGECHQLNGNEIDAASYYLTASKAMEQELSFMGKTGQVIGREDRRYYRGDQFEKVFLHYFLGRAFMLQEKYEEARIEFLKSNELDISSQPEEEHDVTIANSLLGETYLALNNPEEAAVSFRGVTESEPSFPYSYLELSRIYRKTGDERKAREFFDKYLALDRNNAKFQFEDQNDEGTLEVIIEMGIGPIRTGGVTNSKSAVKYPDRAVSVSLIGSKSAEGFMADNVYHQAEHEAGKASHAVKEIGTRVTKKVLNQLTMGLSGAAVGTGDEVDIRRVKTLPGEFQIVQIPAKKGLYTIKVDFLDAEKNVIPEYNQVWHFIPVKEHRKTSIFLRATPYLQNQDNFVQN